MAEVSGQLSEFKRRYTNLQVYFKKDMIISIRNT
jgi:hypothetical protein